MNIKQYQIAELLTKVFSELSDQIENHLTSVWYDSSQATNFLFIGDSPFVSIIYLKNNLPEKYSLDSAFVSQYWLETFDEKYIACISYADEDIILDRLKNNAKCYLVME